MSAT
jgi:hypothetical protein